MVEFYAEEARITFKERLFSFNWFKKFKIINKSKPSSKIIEYKNYLIMHPDTKYRLLEALEDK